MTYDYITINGDEELFEYFLDYINSLKEKKRITDLMDEMGIKDTMNLFDERILQLIDLYEGYAGDTSKLNYGVLFEVTVILNKLKKVQYGYY